MKNIGPVSGAWLRAVGVHSKDELVALGAVEAFRLIKLHGFNASLNLLYALEGAIRDLRWTDLPAPVKAKLRRAARALPNE